MFENKTWEPQFKERLEKHYDELKWLYAELYLPTALRGCLQILINIQGA